MQSQTRATADENPFASSAGVFSDLTTRLASRETLEMTHGDLERLRHKDGRERAARPTRRERATPLRPSRRMSLQRVGEGSSAPRMMVMVEVIVIAPG